LTLTSNFWNSPSRVIFEVSRPQNTIPKQLTQGISTNDSKEHLNSSMES